MPKACSFLFLFFNVANNYATDTNGRGESPPGVFLSEKKRISFQKTAIASLLEPKTKQKLPSNLIIDELWIELIMSHILMCQFDNVVILSFAVFVDAVIQVLMEWI